MSQAKNEASSEDYERQVLTIAENAINCAIEKADEKGIEKILDFIRKECQFEMNVMGTRVTWLLTAQAFLASAYVAAISNALIINARRGGVTAILSGLISLLGFAISTRSVIAIGSARDTIDRWHERTRLLLSHLTPKVDTETGSSVQPYCWHATLLGRWMDPDDRVHKESVLLSTWLPHLFQGFWGILFGASTWVSFILLRSKL